MSGATPSGGIGRHDPLLRVRDLVQEFRTHAATESTSAVVRAVSGVSFEINRGETLAIVGESGSGKTSLVRALLQIPRPTSGSVYLNGENLTSLRGRELLKARRHAQLVFQDPFASVNPKWAVRDIVAEPLVGYRIGNREQRCRKVREVLERVGLPEKEFGSRRPRQLSGGQCQRVALARALAVSPELIICDEALSALDVLIRAQLVSLLLEIQRDLNISCLFISHDLPTVRRFSHRVAVLHSGRICEIGRTESVFSEPRHPYTQMLLSCNQDIQ